MNAVLVVVAYLIIVYTYVMIVRVIMGYILALSQYRPSGAAAVAFEAVYTVTDPPVRFLRRFIPDLRVGNVSIDIAFIVLLIGLRIIAGQLLGLAAGE